MNQKLGHLRKSISQTILCAILCMNLFSACKEDSAGKINPGPNANEIEVAYFEDYESPEHKWGYINETGQVVVKPIYDMVHDIHAPYTGANYQGKWGFINQDGTEVIPFLYKQVYPFENDVTLVQNFDDKWSIINAQGQVIKALDADNMRPFKEGLAVVIKGGQQGIVNSKGEILLKSSNDQIKIISGKQYIVSNTGASKVMDISGNVILEGYDKIYPPHNGYYRVRKNDQYQYVPISTLVALPPVFDKAFDFHYEMTIAHKDGSYVLLSNDLKTIKALPFEKVEYAGERHWKFRKDGKWGILDENGSQMSSPKFDLLNKYVDGLIAYSVNDIWGYANDLGLKVIPPSYVLAWDFHKGKARVIGSRGVGFIDPNNKMVVPDNFFEVRDFHEGLARFQTF